MHSRRSNRLSIEIGLLGFFIDRSRHGYDLYRELSESDGLWLVWRMKQSQLYALLTRLEERGFLRSALESQGGRPPRKVFELTDPGRAAFLTWLTTPIEHGRQFRLDLLTKLYFAHRQGAGVVSELLDAQRQVCLSWISDLSTNQEAEEKPGSFEKLVKLYRIGQIRAMVAWLNQCSDELNLNADE